MEGIGDKVLIPALVFISTITIGASILITIVQKRESLSAKLRKSAWKGSDAGDTTKKKSGILAFFENIGNITSHGRASTTLWEELIRAGYNSKAAPAIYTGIKMMFFAIGIVSTAIFVVPTQYHITAKMTLIFMAGSILFFIPNVFLKIRLKERHDEISRHLPEAIDMLEICVSSGMGLAMAWNTVADEIQNVSPTLAGAMALTNFEIHLGVSRVEAMRHMADRTGVDKLSSLAAILVQTERFGTSVAVALQIFAESMREERFSEVEEQAEKIAAKLIIPMILFIFPAIFVIVVGPAVLTIMKTFETVI